MIITILCFGIAKEIVGKQKLSLTVENKTTISKLHLILRSKYKKLSTIPFLLSVNAVYAKDKTKLRDGDEVAIIPPTNGG